MVDFGNALLLSAVVFILVKAASLMFPTLPSKFKIPMAYGFSLVAVFLVSASSTFAATNLVAGVPLDKVDIATKFLVALFLAAIAVGINYVVPGGLKAISNIGTSSQDLPQ